MSLDSTTIGVFLTEKKRNEPYWLKVAEVAGQENIKIVPLDLTKPIREQGKFDLILCKLNSEIGKQKHGDPQAHQMMQNIQQFATENPHIPFIDPVAVQIKLMCRLEMEKILNKVRAQMKELASVQSTLLSDGENAPEILKEFPFPAIAKSIDAGGSHQAHEMGLVYNISNLERFTRPVLVQQFHNHNSTIYKAYVTFPRVFVDVRPSLPNFEASDDEPLLFNSQDFTELQGEIKELKPPSDDLLHHISNTIHQESGLTLFGFDLIYCVKVEQYTVIDINFYPGYAGVPSFPTNLIDLIKTKINKKL